MDSRTRLLFFSIVILVLSALAAAVELPETEPLGFQQVSNWPAPLLWKPPAPARVPGEARPQEATAASAPLPFIALTPCRIVDTRGTAGVPINTGGKFAANEVRTWTFTGLCGIPASAAAVSTNITVTNTDSNPFGFIKVWPAGLTEPNVSTVNWSAGGVTDSNAAIVPLGTGGNAGQVSLRSGNAGSDVIVDVNGYYGGNGVITGVSPGTGMTGGGTSGTVTLGINPGGVTSTELANNSVTSSKIAANAVTAGAIATGQVVKSINGLFDGVTLSPGSNVTITPSGQTLTIASTAGGVPNINGITGAVTINGTGSVSVGTVGSTITAVGAVTLPPSGAAGGSLSGTYPNPTLGVGVVGASNMAAGQVVKSLNGATDAVTVVGSGGTSVSTVGSTLTVSTPVYVPAGGLILGKPGDTTLINAGFTQTALTQDFWISTTTKGAPPGRAYATAVWTGTRMIVWGGRYTNSGGKYDPAADSWTATTTTAAPTGRAGHTAVWNGSRMIIWGGSLDPLFSLPPLNTGGEYDPVADSWIPTATATAPTPRYYHTAVWSDDFGMIVWGGYDGTSYLNDGGIWNGGGWTDVPITGAPAGRAFHTAVWTGSKMIVWGGFDGTNSLNTGGRYDPYPYPDLGTWSPTTTNVAPEARQAHTAVWTGSRMIVWGGNRGTNYKNSGGQYDPTGDSWTATSTAGLPTARANHTAVWTGTKMVVWGGNDETSTNTNTGGQYDPAGDSWIATSTIGAPTARTFHTAVWTGTKMIVWGGNDGGFPNTGGQYSIFSLYVKN